MFKRIKRIFGYNYGAFTRASAEWDLNTAKGVIELLDYIQIGSMDELKMVASWFVIRFIVRPNNDPNFRAAIVTSNAFKEIIEKTGYLLLEPPKTKEK